MSPSVTQQIIGNVCAGLATLVFLVPLQRFLAEWARREVSNDQWVAPALYHLVPLWLLLMVALLCVTASGGFDWIRPNRPLLYALTVAAALALAAVSFVFIPPQGLPRNEVTLRRCSRDLHIHRNSLPHGHQDIGRY